MIYLLYGDDIRRARGTLAKFQERFRREVSDEWRFIDFEDDLLAPEFERIVAGDHLFAKKDYCIIQHASRAPEEFHDAIKKKVEQWKKDDSVIVFYEREVPLKNAIFEYIKKIAKSEEFAIPASQRRGAPKRDDRNLFVVGDLWGRREVSKLIVTYHKMIEVGFAPDDIMRTLLWHVKNLFLASVGKTREMKPFVARKAEAQARNFTPRALEDSYRALVMLDDKHKKDTLETRLLHFFLTN